MKKLLCIFLLLTLVAFTLVACGGEQTPEHIHSFGEWDLTKKPTCTEDGTKVRYCDCGEKQSEIVVALGHTPKSTFITVDPTYESDGAYYEVVSCSTCGEKLSETTHKIPMLKHTPAEAVEENHISATCYAEGSYEMVVYCAECDAELERAKHTIPMIEHTPASAVEENYSDSTCYAEGSKDLVVYCSVAECRKELERNTETIGKKAHTPASAVEENRVNPTYEKDGSYQMVVYCSVTECGIELERTTHTIDMLVHHPGSVVVENTLPATCTKAGSYDEVVYCLDADCGHKELSRKTISVPVLAHTNGEAVEEKRVNATCYCEGSYDSVVYCSVCNTELSRSKVTLQKIAHTPAEAVIENRVEASCTVNGSYDEVVYCSVENCKVQISRTTKIVDALGHDFTDGLCTVCGEVDPDYVKPDYSVGLEYTSNGDGTCYVSGIDTCNDTEIVIPKASPNREIVTGIGNGAFQFCSSFTSVVIPDSVTSIDSFAFSECDSLVSVELPASITYLGKGVFYSCSNLKNIVVDGNNPAYKSVDGNLFSKNGEILLQYIVRDDVREFVVPSGVKQVAEYSYSSGKAASMVFIEGIEALYYGSICATHSVTIPSTVKRVPTDGGGLFGYGRYVEIVNNSSIEFYYQALEIHSGKSKLKFLGDFIFYVLDGTNYLVGYTGTDRKIVLPDDLNGESYVIYKTAFRDWVDINSITIGAKISDIQNGAFSKCIKLVEVINKSTLQIEAGSSDYGNVAYQAIRVHTGDSVLSVLDEYVFYSFNGANYLVDYIGEEKYIVLPDNYYGKNYEINQSAFRGKKIVSIVLSDGVTKIGSNAFCDCTDLLSVSMGASLKQIDSYAFYNCTWLKDVYITDLGGWCSIVFNDEYSNPLAYANNLYLNNNILNNLVIPDGVTNVSKYAFYGCDSMVSVFIPSCVESIGNSSFDYCSNLEVVTIQDGLTVIPNGAFKYSSKISRITIPVTVKSMELYAFYQGDSIDIFYEGSAKQWNEIKINSYDGSNRCIIQGKHYYYSETEPTTEGNFWHYVNGEIVVWFA